MAIKHKLDEFWYSDDLSQFSRIIKSAGHAKELFEYMGEKTKSPVKLHFYNESTSSDFVFLVPTMDPDGSHAVNLRKQLGSTPSIFIQSSGIDFNYAHSCNKGIGEALKHHFEWIIICNDDIILQEGVENLFEKVTANSGQLVFTPGNSLTENNRYHGEEFSIFKFNFQIMGLSLYNSRWSFEGNRISWKFIYNYLRNFPFLLKNMKYTVAVNETMLAFNKLSSQVSQKMVNFADFGIFHSTVLENDRFDETFWNGTEDYELANRLYAKGIQVKKIDFPVESIGSASLGRSLRKRMIGVLNSLYFSYKISKAMDENNPHDEIG